MSHRDKITAALAKLRQIAGENATYTRGESSLSLTEVVFGSRKVRGIDAEGRTIETRHQSVLIARDALESLEEPEEGDIILRVLHGQQLRFIALPDHEDKVWTWSDHGQTQFRIHVQQIGQTEL